MEISRTQSWNRIVAEVTSQYGALPESEKNRLTQSLEQIEELQRRLDAIFQEAEGNFHCAACAGGCCAKGHNHMTLANLLYFVSRGLQPPPADFTAECPFLGEGGCLLPAPGRPYNCISFVCDIIEAALPGEQTAEFYRLESCLRSLYFSLAGRYSGAAMTGLLLQHKRLQGSSFFTMKAMSTDVEGEDHVVEF